MTDGNGFLYRSDRVRERWIITSVDGTRQYFGRGEWGPVDPDRFYAPTRSDLLAATWGRDDMVIVRVS